MTDTNDNRFDIQSKDFWIARWEETMTGTPFNVHSGYATPRYWDNAAKDYDRGEDHQTRTYAAAVIEKFRGNGLLEPGTKALDIGCGTGRLAVALAREGIDVTAVDFSQGMLDRIPGKLDGVSAKHIQTRCLDWDAVDIDSLGWRKAFDIVIAHMTPAIRRPTSFFKMLDASRTACLLKGWAGLRKNEVLAALWHRVMGEDMRDRTPDVIFEFNLLYAMGYYPDMSIEVVSFDRESPVEDAIKHYIDYFSGVADKPMEAVEPVIRGYLEGIAENGVVHEHTIGRTGTMFWKM